MERVSVSVLSTDQLVCASDHRSIPSVYSAVHRTNRNESLFYASNTTSVSDVSIERETKKRSLVSKYASIFYLRKIYTAEQF